MQSRGIDPFCDFAFGGGGKCTVERGNKDVIANTHALLTFTAVLINDFPDAQLLGDIEENSYSTF